MRSKIHLQMRRRNIGGQDYHNLSTVQHMNQLYLCCDVVI